MTPPLLPDPATTPRETLVRTAVANVRHVPLKRLAESGLTGLRRVIPPADTTKLPVAAFDASL